MKKSEGYLIDNKNELLNKFELHDLLSIKKQKKKLETSVKINTLNYTLIRIFLNLLKKQKISLVSLYQL